MSGVTVMQVLTLGLSALSVGCALFVILRSGKWRETDEAKALILKVEGHGTRLSVLEAEVQDLPTKQDLARVEGRVATVEQIGVRTERAVERIESHLMKLKEVS